MRRDGTAFVALAGVVIGLAATYLAAHLLALWTGIDVKYVPGVWILMLCGLAIANVLIWTRS